MPVKTSLKTSIRAMEKAIHELKEVEKDLNGLGNGKREEILKRFITQ